MPNLPTLAEWIGRSWDWVSFGLVGLAVRSHMQAIAESNASFAPSIGECTIEKLVPARLPG